MAYPDRRTNEIGPLEDLVAALSGEDVLVDADVQGFAVGVGHAYIAEARVVLVLAGTIELKERKALDSRGVSIALEVWAGAVVVGFVFVVALFVRFFVLLDRAHDVGGAGGESGEEEGEGEQGRVAH